jgi:hypothetical protein
MVCKYSLLKISFKIQIKIIGDTNEIGPPLIPARKKFSIEADSLRQGRRGGPALLIFTTSTDY